MKKFLVAGCRNGACHKEQLGKVGCYEQKEKTQ